MVANGLELLNADRPVYGVNVHSVRAVPQPSGFASGACGPPFSLRMKSLKGCWGLFRNVVSSLPVVGFGFTWPSSLTETPYLGLSAST